jgi:hypothetical protein
MKIHLVGAEFFHGDARTGERQTDRTKLAVAFLDFVKAANMAEVNNYVRLRNIKLSLLLAILRWSPCQGSSWIETRGTCCKN